MLQVTLPNSYSRNGLIYYQRAVPKDLQDRYPHKLIKINLKTGDIVSAEKRIRNLNEKFEAEWSAMRADPHSSPKALKAHAEALLREFGLSPAPAANDDLAVSQFYDRLDAKREAYAGDDELLYRENPAEEYLSPVEIKAAQLLAGRSKETLSDALEVYLAIHHKRYDKKFSTYTRRAFQTLIAVIGDKAMEDLSREDAHRYVKSESKLSTGTIRRRINTINAVMKTYLRERDLNRANPFEAVPILAEGKDAKKRVTFTPAELVDLYKACKSKDDSLRWLISLIADTGARLAEVTGLSMDDIRLDAEVPHIVIQPHPWRSLKNRSSAREVPLVGASLWAAQRIKSSAVHGQRFAFPRYTNEASCNANNASAAAGKWLRSIHLDHTPHELRHTIVDRLREAQCPEDVRFAIGGWASQEVGTRYGYGYGLKVKADWLSKIALKGESHGPEA
nr:tyrosine-type recombinase/integrase [Duganella qianjiadongensis]